jgi:hypothetical protein
VNTGAGTDGTTVLVDVDGLSLLPDRFTIMPDGVPDGKKGCVNTGAGTDGTAALVDMDVDVVAGFGAAEAIVLSQAAARKREVRYCMFVVEKEGSRNSAGAGFWY